MVLAISNCEAQLKLCDCIDSPIYTNKPTKSKFSFKIPENVYERVHVHV